MDAAHDEALSGNVRILLVAADFSTELTTAVLWLNKQDLDIRCVRIRPHRLGVDVIIDATQIIPLPEAADYEVKLRAIEQTKRTTEREKFRVCRIFWAALLARAASRTSLFAVRSAANGAVLAVGMSRSGFALNAVLEHGDSRVEMFFRAGSGSGYETRSESIFRAVHARKEELDAAS